MTQGPGARRLAWCSLAGIVIYVAIDLVLKFLRPEYSLVYNAESDYGRGQYFWVMDLNFLLRCALSLGVVVALRERVRSTKHIRVGLGLLVVWALCSGLLAFFADDLEGQPQRGSGVVHLALAFVAFICVTIGAVVVSSGLRLEAAWRSAGARLLAISVLGVVAFLLMGAALGHKHGPDGLYERIFLGIELLWFGVAAWYCVKRTPSTALNEAAAR